MSYQVTCPYRSKETRIDEPGYEEVDEPGYEEDELYEETC